MLVEAPVRPEEINAHNNMVWWLKIITPIVLALSGGLAVYLWRVARRRDMARLVGGITLVAALASGGTYFWLVGRYTVRDRPPENSVLPGFDKLNQTKMFARVAVEASLAGRHDESKQAAARVLAGVEALLAELRSTTHPFALSGRVLQAQALRLSGEPKMALQVLEELFREPALQWQPDRSIPEAEVYTQAILERAELLLAENRFPEAIPLIKACEKIANFGNHDVQACGHCARFGLATFYDRLGDYARSRATYARITERFEGPEKSWANQARAQITDLDRRLPSPNPIQDPKARIVSGALSGKNVWSREHGPYHVTETAEVLPDARLEIGPGTLIRFGEGARLVVRGTLLAHGGTEESERIRLTSLDQRRGAFAWGGVIFDSSDKAERSVMEGLRLDGADYGLTVKAGRLSVRDSLFTYCGRVAVRVLGPTGQPIRKHDPAAQTRVLMERMTIRDNLGTGIEFRGADVSALAVECGVEKNEEFGVLISEQADPEIRGCRIQHNGEDGVIVLRAARGRLTDKTLITHNGGVGVRLDLRCKTELQTIEIRENADGGIAANDSELRLIGSAVKANRGPAVRLGLNVVAHISGSSITDNAGPGVRADAGCKVLSLLNCSVTGNTVGISLAEVSSISLAANDLSANKTAALHSESANAVDARDNFWGPTTVEEIRKQISGPAKAVAAVSLEPFRTAKP